MLKLNQTAHSIDIFIFIKYICYFNRRHPFVFQFESETECLEVTVRTLQHFINSSILLWQNVSVLLDHLHITI
jgi:hypothetical protein